VNIDLTNTTSAKIGSALAEARAREGAPTTGAVLTLVIATDERGNDGAMTAACEAARAHPCRILSVIPRAPSAAVRLDAEIRAAGPGERVVLRLYGSLGEHADSVVLPLLLPDTPVVVWWPDAAPDAPAESVLGRLASRRVTDAAAATKALGALEQRGRGYRAGDTDFAWTRLTPWRATLAAAMDHPYDDIESIEVAAAKGNPSAPLLAAWLSSRLGVPAAVRNSRGPGITAVALNTMSGPIELTRPDGRRATLSRPGRPDRMVALLRRSTADCLGEELRRLDPDEPYCEALQLLSTVGRAKAASR
jgi:glucose-6-phosphate dehydrogenase assembly protein OpcA